MEREGGRVFHVAKLLRISETGAVERERLASEPGEMIDHMNPAGEAESSARQGRLKHPTRQSAKQPEILDDDVFDREDLAHPAFGQNAAASHHRRQEAMRHLD